MTNDIYTVYWHRYPHGKEGEAMDCKQRDFTDYEKAVEFLNGRYKTIGGIYWAGGRVENADGFVRYELTDGSEVFTADPTYKEVKVTWNTANANWSFYLMGARSWITTARRYRNCSE
jgi:hypothetical protein